MPYIHVITLLITGKKTPFYVSLTEAIHDTCRSKTLLQIMNILGLRLLFFYINITFIKIDRLRYS